MKWAELFLMQMTIHAWGSCGIVGLASHRPELLGFSWSLTSDWDRQASFWIDHATMRLIIIK